MTISLLALLVVALGAATPPDGTPVAACTRASRGLQDQTRILRNGLTKGDTVGALRRELTLIANYAQDLEAAEAAFVASLGAGDQARVDADLASLVMERDALAQHVEELTTAARTDAPDRARLQAAAREIGRHARLWEMRVRATAARLG